MTEWIVVVCQLWRGLPITKLISYHINSAHTSWWCWYSELSRKVAGWLYMGTSQCMYCDSTRYKQASDVTYEKQQGTLKGRLYLMYATPVS